MKASSLPHQLLSWYDTHGRTLPWRAKPSERADPYRVWLSEVMLQQTTVATVGPYFTRFTATWPTVNDLAAAPLEAVLSAWAGLGYYSRARNLHACAQAVVSDHGGAFPDTEAELRALPGVGPYTAAAIAAIAFDRPAVVVDGNIDRVITRLHASQVPIAQNKAAIRTWAAELTPTERPGDYAQALMDLGATICRPVNPSCLLCPIRSHCKAHGQGVAAELPVKVKKPPKPVRLGQVYLIHDAEGRLLIDRRPPNGLLGGMDGLPTSTWATSASPPLPGTWAMDTEVRHTFTHFHLRLQLHGGDAALAANFPEARFIAVQDFEGLALPTLFKKVLKVANPPG